MFRRFLKRHMPSADSVRRLRAFGVFGDTLFHPALWHLNRRTASGGIAVGLFCGLIPGPLQMPGAAVAAVLLRVNLPAALFTTLYTNPLTIVPLYVVAYALGTWVLGGSTEGMSMPPDFSAAAPMASLKAYGEWVGSLGAPLAVGLLLLATLLSAAGYLLVRTAWEVHLRLAWRQRRRRRLTAEAAAAAAAGSLRSRST